MEDTSQLVYDRIIRGDIVNHYLKVIGGCLRVAGKHNGLCFGGYVRDVLLKDDSVNELKFKDIDIWFRKEEDAKKFISDMGDMLVVDYQFTDINENYEFKRKQYNLFDDFHRQIRWVDVIVNDTIPVNDFNVNKLTYNGFTHKFKSYGEETTEELIKNIKHKEAIMLNSYIEFNMIKKQQLDVFHFARVFYKRIKRNYHKKGWKVSLENTDYIIKKTDSIRTMKKEIDDCIMIKFAAFVV